MQLVSCHDGRLYLLKKQEGAALPGEKAFRTGLGALDEVLPGEGLSRGAVHEVLCDPREGMAMTFALLLAKAAAGDGVVVWCDPHKTLYPPAVAARGVRLDRLYLLRPKRSAELVWAVAECMSCAGVGATVAAAGDLSRVEARRFQLAAERGGGAGILLRDPRHATHYAAATRWRVTPVKGERSVQRWSVQLIHGHGGQVGKTIFLECARGADANIQANPVRAVAAVADRPVEKAARRA